MRRALVFAVMWLAASSAAAIPRALWPGMDWGGVQPLATDPQGDQRYGAIDIRSLSVTSDRDNLYLKVDHYGPVDKGASYEFALNLPEPDGDVGGFATNFFPRGMVMWFVTDRRPEVGRRSASALGAAIMSSGHEVQVRIPLNLTRGHAAFKVRLGVWPPGDHEEPSDRIPDNSAEWVVYQPGGVEARPASPTPLATTSPLPVPARPQAQAWQGEDWQGVAPLATDAAGDHALGTDIKSLSVKEDPSFVYLKVDLYTDSNNPAHIYEFLFDATGDGAADYSANVQLGSQFHIYAQSPFKELPATGAAVVYGRNWMQSRIPRLPVAGRYLTAARVWPAGHASERPGDTVYETGWTPPEGEGGPAGRPSYLGVALVAVVVLALAAAIGRTGRGQA